jgi:uncharacterized protein
MLLVTVFRNENGLYTGAELDGHAGKAPQGMNIVCASVSALLKTLLLGLQKELGLHVLVKSGEGGFFSFRIPDMGSEENRQQAGLLFRTFVLGLEWVASQQEAENSITIQYAG